MTSSCKSNVMEIVMESGDFNYNKNKVVTIVTT